MAQLGQDYIVVRIQQRTDPRNPEWAISKAEQIGTIYAKSSQDALARVKCLELPRPWELAINSEGEEE